MTSLSWRRTPWQADPLSWVTAPYLPLVAALLTLVHGLVVLVAAGQVEPRPRAQYAALVIAVVGIGAVHVVTRPRGARLSATRIAALAIAPAAAVVVSAAGYIGEPFSIELWWAPLAASLFLMALSPYISMVRMATLGFGLAAVTAVTTLLIVVPDDARWPPFTIVSSAIMPIAIGTIGGMTIIASLTRGLERWSERPLAPLSPEGSAAVTDAVDAVTSERIREGRLLLRRVIDSGVVTDDDAQKAAELAAKLRQELAGDIDRTWLQRAVVARAVQLDDPLRLAERLDLSQRTALRALLDALLPDDGLASGSARVELRETKGGAVAVALRIISTLPEGQRESFLAPYYVSLESTVQNLRWRTGPVTAVSFEVGGALPRAATDPLRPPPAGMPGGPRL